MAKQHPTTFLPMAAGYAPLVGHHRHLLDDKVRTQAYLKAIASVVKPGDTVADLGTGTGVLAIAARRAGAKHVWAIDHDPIVKVAAAIAKDNGIDGITFLEEHSRKVALPEPVDVIVSECFGPMGVGGSMVPAVIDLRSRFLKPGGRMIPGMLTMCLAPVEAAALYAHVTSFAKPRYELDWSAARRLATHNVYNTVIEPRALLAPGMELHRIDFGRHAWAPITASTIWKARRAGVVHGFAGWFVADLGGGVTLSTAPGKPQTIWRQVLFPLTEPVRVKQGAQITIAVTATGDDFDWAGSIGGAQFRCSTRYSYPSALTP